MTIAAAVVVVLGAIELATSGRLDRFVDRFRGPTDLSETVLSLDRAIDGTLVKLGVAGMTGGEEDRDDGRYTWRHREMTGNLP